MKEVLITGGPTNEIIDEVMKITNMSTGSLSLALSKDFLKAGYGVSLVINKGVYTKELTNDAKDLPGKLRLISVDTTEEMMAALFTESKARDYNVVIHAAAVGDYKADYTFLLEDMAAYVWQEMCSGTIKSEEDLLKALCNGDKYKIGNSSKISSYQENLTVKLGLTPKIIARLREWFPESLLVGCKLLDKVSKEELFEVANKLCVKNKMDYILANDLWDLREGKPARYLVDSNGFTGNKLESPEAISKWVQSLI